MKTGILGGTFNPIHNGHIAIGLAALEEYRLDRILVMPSGVSYLKEGTGVLGSSIRREMTRLAIEDIDRFVLDDREVRRAGNSYTCDTLNELRDELGPEEEFYYIIGADTLYNIEKWRNIDVIFGECTLLVSVRDDVTLDDLKTKAEELKSLYNARICFLHIDEIDISSSMIRERVHEGSNIDGLVDDKVYKYILDNNLYK